MITLSALETLIAEAGRKLLALRGTEKIAATRDIDQLKTQADRLLHDHLCTALRALAPVIPIISEEDAGHRDQRPGRYFLIDPVDGTASFAYGFDGFVTQVAFMEGGKPLLAAIHAPVMKWLFSAGVGQGAFLNGKPIRVNNDTRRLVLTDNYPEPRGTAARLMESLGATDYLESGSIALKICRVADGSADLFFKDVVVRDWDVAPADVILAEAGGLLSLPDGHSYCYDGNFVKPGLIAARDRHVLDRCASLLQDSSIRPKGEPS